MNKDELRVAAIEILGQILSISHEIKLIKLENIAEAKIIELIAEL